MRRATATLLVLASATAAAAQQSATASPSPAMRISGALGAPVVDAGQYISFQLTLTNLSNGELRDVVVAHVGGPHVTLSAADWCADLTWRGLTGPPCVVTPSLAPGQSTTVSGVLHAATPVQANVSATVQWTAAESARPSRAAASLGTLVVEDWKVRWMRASSDFALPLVVALLGIWFQWRLKRLEDRRQVEAADRAEKAEAWRLMLPVSHEYAVTYYANLVETAKLMIKRTGGARLAGLAAADRRAAEREAFYAWLMLHTRKRVLQQKGAYYFKNHVAELLVPSLFGAYWVTFVVETTPAATAVTSGQQSVQLLLDRSVAALTPDETREAMLQKLDYAEVAGEPLADLFTWFRGRLTRPRVDEAMQFLGAYADLLFFEMNRPYEPWFSTGKVRLAMSEPHLKGVFAMLAMATGAQLKAMEPQVVPYLRDAGISEAAVNAARQ